MSRILLLGSQNDPAKDMVYNAINPQFEISAVILEKPGSRRALVKRRIRKLGLFRVIGQVCFQLLAVNLLNTFSRKRIKELRSKLQLDTTPVPAEKVRLVNSINDDEALKLIRDMKPDLVLVKGTRILSERILNAVDVPFINMHVGITPFYRGVHGAYWALANNDRKNAGTTIHYVDTGIDTGNIIAQQPIEISNRDNFVTYPLIQIATGIGLLKTHLPSILQGQKIQVQHSQEGVSRLWSHPTIWYYLKKRFINGIK